MSDKPETIADIVAAIRGVAKPDMGAPDWGADITPRELMGFADRLDAAAARIADDMGKLVVEKSKAENSLNLAQMQVQAMEEKRTAMNRLYTLTSAVRKAQKAYFVSRTSANLRASKAAERNLDAFLVSLHQRQLAL